MANQVSHNKDSFIVLDVPSTDPIWWRGGGKPQIMSKITLSKKVDYPNKMCQRALENPLVNTIKSFDSRTRLSLEQ